MPGSPSELLSCLEGVNSLKLNCSYLLGRRLSHDFRSRSYLFLELFVVFPDLLRLYPVVLVWLRR